MTNLGRSENSRLEYRRHILRRFGTILQTPRTDTLSRSVADSRTKQETAVIHGQEEQQQTVFDRSHRKNRQTL